MADDLLSLADLILINDRNLADIDVTDLLQDAPLLQVLPATVASNGTTHKYVKETGAPVVGFRVVNDGREHDSSVDTLVTTNLAILDATFKTDVSLASEYFRGTAAYLDRELQRHLRAAFALQENQIYYGTTADGDSTGFDGINDTLSALSNAAVHPGGGATNLTSVYLIRAGEDDFMSVLGNDGQIETVETPSVIEVAGSVTGTFPAWFVPVTGWMTVQLGSIHSVHRLANISTDGTAGSLTDDLIADAVAAFPAAKQPTHIMMHRFARRDLKKSRTATNPTGAPAPTPIDVEGVPIIVSDQINVDEAIVT